MPVCQVGAFTEGDVVQELLTCVARLETASVELVCQENSSSETGVIADSTGIQLRGCLAGLGTGAYMTMVAIGSENIYVRMDACPGCKWGSLQPTIQEQVSRAKELLAAWGRSDCIHVVSQQENTCDRPLWDAHNPPLSRRELFQFATRQGKVALARSMELNSGSKDQQPGRDRRRVLNAFRQLPTPSSTPALKLDDTYVLLSASESCTACGTCARTCPTGALTYTTDEDETRFDLSFSPQLCVGCDLCVHVCLPASITIEHSPMFSQVFGQESSIVLREGGLSHCEVCKTVFPSAPDTYVCPVCDYRRKNPFGSRLPPGLNLLENKLTGE
jgi:ferredoxin